MAKKSIVVPGLYRRGTEVHAMRIGNLVLTTAVAALDDRGAAIDSKPDAQAQAAYDALGAVLEAAGATWSNVVRLARYVDPSMPTNFAPMAESCERKPGEFGYCGTTIPLGSGVPGVFLRLEATAVVGQISVPLKSQGLRDDLATASATQGLVHMSGRLEQRACAGKLADQTGSIYEAFDQLLKQADLSWDNLTRVRQYLACTGADFNQVRKGRETFVPAGRFLSTSVAMPPLHSTSNPESIIVELHAESGVKEVFSKVAFEETPGTAHAMRRGDLIHVQAHIADEKDRIQHVGDIDGQTRLVLKKLGAALAAAGVNWSNVIASRVFCKNAEDIGIVRQIEDELIRHEILKLDHMSRFFDEDALVEIEVTAHA